MAIIRTEAVAVTRSALTKGYNGDSINLNGNVVSAEHADAPKGFKTYGSTEPPFRCAVGSSNKSAFALGAVTAFNDYRDDMLSGNADGFLNDMKTVTGRCEGAQLSLASLCAVPDGVYVSRMGDCHVLRFSDGELFEIALPGDNGSGFQLVDDVRDGDMFALLSADCSKDLRYEDIVALFDSDRDLKTLLRDLYRITASDNREADKTVVLVKIVCDEEPVAVTPPVIPAAGADAGVFEPEPPVEETELEPALEDLTTEVPDVSREKTRHPIFRALPIAVFVILVGVAAGIFFATHSDKVLKPKTTESSTGDAAVSTTHGIRDVDEVSMVAVTEAPGVTRRSTTVVTTASRTEAPANNYEEPQYYEEPAYEENPGGGEENPGGGEENPGGGEENPGGGEENPGGGEENPGGGEENPGGGEDVGGGEEGGGEE